MHDYLKIAYRNLWERKTRSLLTILGILLAILTIFVLLSLSLGLNEFVQEQFELLGTDKFFIQPKGQLGAPGTGGAVELTIDDVEVVDKIKGVEKATYFAATSAKIEYKDETRYYYSIGIPQDDDAMDLVFEATDLNMEDGKFLKRGDSKKVMVGSMYKHNNLFEKSIQPGDTIELNDVSFEVVGVLEPVGNPGDDQQVYISFDDFKEIFDVEDVVDIIYVQIKEGSDMIEVSERVERKLMDYRDVDEKTIDFTILTPEELLETFGNILNILTAFLVGIGAISLLVGGIGIANTMYTSVLERRKEIGTMKAVGARNSDILMIFVIEAGILGLVGGLLGLLGGIIIAKGIVYVVSVFYNIDMLRASLDLRIIIGSLLFAFLIGIASGLLPSYQASKLKPVDALRYE